MYVGSLTVEIWSSSDWRPDNEFEDKRPKKGLGGLTPAAYAEQLTARAKAAKVTAGL